MVLEIDKIINNESYHVGFYSITVIDIAKRKDNLLNFKKK